jgi:hypothetical protein
LLYPPVIAKASSNLGCRRRRTGSGMTGGRLA